MCKSQTKKIKNRYNRISIFYDFFESIVENKLFKKWRKKTIFPLKGKILEIGVGTGKNLPYYSDETEVVAIDFSSKMLKKAKRKLEKLGKQNIKLIEMDAQELQFEDSTFDYVVTTFVWCSVPYAIKGLSEAKRVLKNDGEAIFLEHVLSKNKIIALWQNIHNPITKFLFGFNVNRNTKHNIIQAGFKIIEEKNLALVDVFRLFRASK